MYQTKRKDTAMHGRNIYTVDEYFPPDDIDFISDLEIYVNSLFRMESSPLIESELGDMILNMVVIPLVEEDRRNEHTKIER